MNNGGINKANISNQTPFNHEEVGLWREGKKIKNKMETTNKRSHIPKR